MKFEITSGKLPQPLKVVIYGTESIGKSTLASKFPNPLFIDTENGTSRLDVRRIKVDRWEDIFEVINEVLNNPALCETLVLDTADWSEYLCIKYLLEKNHKNSIEDFGYGKGYTFVGEEYSRLLTYFDKLIVAGKHVVVVAHAKPRKYELPEEEGQFDRYEMKLSKQVAPLLKEWCDMLLFCNFKTYVVTTDNNKKKAQGGKRVMFTNHHPTFDAKNRFGLPDELDLSFDSIAHLVTKNTETKGEDVKTEPTPVLGTEQAKESAILKKLKKLMRDSGVEKEELEYVVVNRGQYPQGSTIEDYKEDFITRWIFPNWNKILEFVNQNKELINYGK